MTTRTTQFRPATWAVAAAILFATILAPSPVGAQLHTCSGWDDNADDISDFTATISQSTDARKGPSSHSSCDRGFDYGAGTSVRVHGQSGNYYWVNNTAAGDWAWIVKSHVSTGSSNSTPAATSGGSDQACGAYWRTDGQDIEDFDAVISRSTSARKAPSSHSSCMRGFNYASGTLIRVTQQSGKFYWVTDKWTGDWAWVAKSEVLTGGIVTLRPSESTPAPTPSPPAPQRLLSVNLLNGTLVCDGELRDVAVISGFDSSEQVTVTINGESYTRPAVNGSRTVRWRCTSGGSFLHFVAAGNSSGAAIDFSVFTSGFGSSAVANRGS